MACRQIAARTLSVAPASLRAARPALALAARQASTAAWRSSPARIVIAPTLSTARRGYAADHGDHTASGLSREEILGRITDILKTFEKVDTAKVSPSADFTTDLGLDSLDAVEVVMAIEEEFTLEIQDDDADKITSIAKGSCVVKRVPLTSAAIDYVSAQPDAQ